MGAYSENENLYLASPFALEMPHKKDAQTHLKIKVFLLYSTCYYKTTFSNDRHIVKK